MASLNRLLAENDPTRLESLQAEARVWEKVVTLPRRLLEVKPQEDS